MVARGAGGGPCASDAIFHGARTSDLASAAAVLRVAAASAARAATTPTSVRVFACGVSMGGIILANHMSRSGKECGLDGAVVLSGVLRSTVRCDKGADVVTRE
jgi:predicted alpha/beta-fold hydrolase